MQSPDQAVKWCPLRNRFNDFFNKPGCNFTQIASRVHQAECVFNLAQNEQLSRGKINGLPASKRVWHRLAGAQLFSHCFLLAYIATIHCRVKLAADSALGTPRAPHSILSVPDSWLNQSRSLISPREQRIVLIERLSHPNQGLWSWRSPSKKIKCRLK